MEGGTTFHFVTDGIESAYAQAEAADGGHLIAAERRALVRRSRLGSSTRSISKSAR